MSKKRVLVVDSGGRGHALVWKLAQSPNVGKLFVATGNGGTKKLAENVPIKGTDIAGLLKFVEQQGVDFTVVGGEDPLVAGIVDEFCARGHRIFGPTRRATEFTEASKAEAKEAMVRAGIPTAPFKIFTDYKAALAYIREHGAPIVVKASGLALGKGAYPCQIVEEAEAALDEIMVKRLYGDAGDIVVIEEFLDGPEVSIHAFCDGKGYVLFPSGQDHKPALDNDLGKNTGGMGTIAPVPWVSADLMLQAGEKVVGPMLQELSQLGCPFAGNLYPGLKVTPTGIKVLEFNARPGDPETQSYMRLLKTDLLEVSEACVDGTLSQIKVEWDSGFAACIVLASGGYPGIYKKGIPILGIKDAEEIPGVVVFQAGTGIVDDVLITTGGRVLGVTATGSTLQEALGTAYHAADLIRFEGKHMRRDIGAKSLAMAREGIAA